MVLGVRQPETHTNRARPHTLRRLHRRRRPLTANPRLISRFTARPTVPSFASLRAIWPIQPGARGARQVRHSGSQAPRHTSSHRPRFPLKRGLQDQRNTEITQSYFEEAFNLIIALAHWPYSTCAHWLWPWHRLAAGLEWLAEQSFAAWLGLWITVRVWADAGRCLALSHIMGCDGSSSLQLRRKDPGGVLGSPRLLPQPLAHACRQFGCPPTVLHTLLTTVQPRLSTKGKSIRAALVRGHPQRHSEPKQKERTECWGCESMFVSETDGFAKQLL